MSGLRSITAVLAILALAGCNNAGNADEQAGGGSAPEVAGPAAAPAEPSLASAPAAFGQCAACHSLAPGKHGIGPSLFAIYGTKAGDIPGYNFSPELKASGLTWDDATLDKWLAGPMQFVPGTKMTYGGMSDAAKRQTLIAYLKTLK